MNKHFKLGKMKLRTELLSLIFFSKFTELVLNQQLIF